MRKVGTASRQRANPARQTLGQDYADGTSERQNTDRTYAIRTQKYIATKTCAPALFDRKGERHQVRTDGVPPARSPAVD